jgi:hypothetical protein
MYGKTVAPMQTTDEKHFGNEVTFFFQKNNELDCILFIFYYLKALKIVFLNHPKNSGAKYRVENKFINKVIDYEVHKFE